MRKKLICWCLALLFALPVPAYASLSSDVSQLEQKYPEIYQKIDPKIVAQMESYLQDVVDYVVENYDDSTSIDAQIKSAVVTVLLKDETYQEGLLPFLLSQKENITSYQTQLSEMNAIVRKEVQARLNAQNSSPGGGGGGGGGVTTPSTPSTPDTDPITPEPIHTFEDINGHWAKTDIETMTARGLVKGVSSTQFEPDREITRAEFAALLLNSLDVKPETQTSGHFLDVTRDCWYFDTVNTAAKMGLVTGYNSDIFGPNDTITREQIATMIQRAMALKGKDVELTPSQTSELLNSFSDYNNISSWAREAIAKAVHKEIVYGRGEGQFAPAATATRAEAAVMVLRMYRQL